MEPGCIGEHTFFLIIQLMKCTLSSVFMILSITSLSPMEVFSFHTITVNNIRPISTCLKFLSGSSFLSVSPWIKVHIERILVQQFQKLYSLWKKLIYCQIPSIHKSRNKLSAESNQHTDLHLGWTKVMQFQILLFHTNIMTETSKLLKLSMKLK